MRDQLQNREHIFVPRHSRPLDITVWTEDPALVGLVQEIWDQHFAADAAEKQRGGRKPGRPYIEQLRVVLTDLYLAWREDPFLCLGMPFSDGAWNSRSRYNPLDLSRQVIGLVRRLEEVRLVRVSTGSYSGPGAVGNRTSRIQAGSALEQRFAALAVDPRALQSAPTECIVLNDDAGRPVEYEDTEETRRMREELTAYNELLARSFIDIPALEDPWIVRQDNDGQDIRVGISPRYQHVRRIFSRNSWEDERQILRSVVARAEQRVALADIHQRYPDCRD